MKSFRSYIWAGWFCALLATVPALGANPLALFDLSDEFESSPSAPLWWLERAVPELLQPQSEMVRSGDRALSVIVDESVETCERRLGLSQVAAVRATAAGDCPPAAEIEDDERCQRNEVVAAENRRVRYGEERWYGFSFRMNGHIPTCGSRRWVIAQWKQSNEFSPFLAQRFDNGVFHITVQDAHCRCRIAVSEGDPDRVAAVGERPLLCHETRPDAPESRARACASRLEVDYPAPQDRLLPDPRVDWVDMAYRVRGDRHSGRIEIYANGQSIATVRGPIGYRSARPERDYQYFKFNQYRQFHPGEAALLIDNFRRGTVRSFVDPAMRFPQGR